MPPNPLRRLRRLLVLFVVVYFVAGSVSQKMLPGVDEIFPFFGWSLFTRVPNTDSRYEIVIHSRNGKAIEPPVPYLRAQRPLVAGSPYLARKVIQNLGQAFDRGDTAQVERSRRLLERNYLRGRLRYELIFERYDPFLKWRSGENLESRSLTFFERRKP